LHLVKKLIANMGSKIKTMEIKMNLIGEELTKIVGPENFSADNSLLEKYSRDYSLSPSGRPNYVVWPRNAEEISRILELANKYQIPVIPVSSRAHFYGATIPKQGGIIIDLSRHMNRILEVDELNRRVRIEAGVTWKQLVEELRKRGFRVIMPLLPHPERSVVTDFLEREVPTNTVYDYGEPLQGMEVVWPTGEIFRTGSASVPGYPDSPSRGANPTGPGIDFYRFLQGAQGTMGIVTWANLKIEYLPKIDKVLFAPVTDLSYIIEFLYRILRLRIGQECLLLNNINLAIILSGSMNLDFEKLRSSLPPWTLVLVLSGLQRRPEEKIQYEEEALRNIVKNEFHEVQLSENLPGVLGAGKKLLKLLREPWPKETYWKHLYKGGCASVFFITKPVLAPKFISKTQEVAAKHGYLPEEIGMYIQPIEHNRACHLEFNFFYDPNDLDNVEKVRGLRRALYPILLNEGAFFTRPYGELAKLVYERAGSYASVLRRLKNIFDPNNIMNPGNLCF